MNPTPDLTRGLTPNEAGRLLRVSPDKVRGWIKRGELSAIDTAPPRSRKPRWVILPHHLEAFEARHRAATATKPARRKRRTTAVDFYP